MGSKQVKQYGVPFPLHVSEEELNSLIQEAIPEKTKLARKYIIKISEVRKKRI